MTFTRVDLAHLFYEKGYQIGVEIGVGAGSYAYTLAKANPQATIHCIDPWLVYDDYADVTDEAIMQQKRSLAYKRLVPCRNLKITRASSAKALLSFEDNSIDFVYIDGNHAFDYVSHDIFNWSQKVKSGGMVSGHDYNHPDVRAALDWYTKNQNITNLQVIGDPARAQSWYWMKP